MLAGAKVAVRLARSRLLGHRMLSLGQALAAGLRAGLAASGVPVWLDTPMTGLVVTDGRVTGVRVVRDGKPTVIRARRGVLIATGGFERNEEMRRRYQRSPIGTDWTTGAAGNTGDGIVAGQRTRRRDRADGRRLVGPVDPAARRAVLLPGRAQPARLRPGQRRGPAVRERVGPLRRRRARHVRGEHGGEPAHPRLAGLRPALPGPVRLRGAAAAPAASPPLVRGGRGVPARRTWPGSATRSASTRTALAKTVARFNDFARAGHDEEFSRGDSAYDRYYGDPRCRPNPNLAPLAKAPFYAVPIVPGDLGTKGGLRTDARARVLREDGSVIAGLYAAGNASAVGDGPQLRGRGRDDRPGHDVRLHRGPRHGLGRAEVIH